MEGREVSVVQKACYYTSHMTTEQFFFGGVVMALVAVASPVSADGGMMPDIVSTVAPTPVVAGASMSQSMTNEAIRARIAILTEMVTLTSYVQALVTGIPEAEYDDEGMITVVVNDNMIAPCDDDEGQTGSECVRHLGKLGNSTADLQTITGFSYDNRFDYDLTLMKTRSDAYGDTTGAQYDYCLVRINDVSLVK